MPGQSRWVRTLSNLLAERLEKLSWTLSQLKQRLRQTLTELLSHFITETVQETIAAAVAPGLLAAPTRGYAPAPYRSDRPWWAEEPEPPGWPQQEDSWQDAEGDTEFNESRQPAQPAHKLATSVEVGCAATACLLKGWPLPMPTALTVGLVAAFAAYWLQPWLGIGLTLATSAMQLLRLVQPPLR